MKPALLVIDVQKTFFNDPTTSDSLNHAIEYINEAISLFRGKEYPVVCIQHTNPDDNLLPGYEGFDIPDSLKILPSDLHIVKRYGNAFNKTSLSEELQKLGVDTVIVTGFCAEYCVLSTCRGARDVDLTAILLRGALASGDPDRIGFVESINEIISFRALCKILE
jgi:nicotinamidase-related amidase